MSGREKNGITADTLLGLSEGEVRRLVERDGFNELPRQDSRHLARILGELVSEPMVTLLIGCGAIYFVLGDAQEASLLVGFLFLILGITLYQERRAENALEALRDLSSPRALVIREGKKRRIAGRELVQGDIILLSEGDRVPADAVILSSRNLSADESLLTGESVPVAKIAEDRVFAGTTLVRGTAVATVTATGPRSELGKIGKAIGETAPEQTPLQKETRHVVRVVALAAGALCISVVIAFSLSRHDWLGGLLAGLTLAMAILPNELPAVLTIFLALGAWRLSQKRVLTRRSPVIEALGAATVLCVDKTGTLTYNRMTIRRLWTRSGYFSLEGTPALPEDFHALIEFGILAGEREPFDPMDLAFQRVGSERLVDTEHLHPEWSLVRQYPLTPELMAVTHAWKAVEGRALPVAAKGAPEAVIDLCHLPEEEAGRILATVREMGDRGLRVLGVAKAKLEQGALPEKAHDFDFEFLGLVGLQDPIRSEVPQAIAECHGAGIRVIMITGDHPDTARSIAREVGLPYADGVITGEELRALTDEELRTRLERTSVCARMVPDQKLRLISTLKAMGEVVAMTGDGVNDAPALKSAHIGIAMGARGTDVARESASLVLLDDDFGSIVSAVRMGRRISDNLRRAMSYLLAVHIPITGISVVPVFFNLPLVLLPIHIAFLHLIIEPACSIAFEAEPESDDIMRRLPRRLNEPLFSRPVLIPTFWMGASILVVLLSVYLIALYRGQGEADARALTFTTLVLSNVWLLLAQRPRKQHGGNHTLLGISLGSLALLAVVLYVPFARELFRFSTLHPVDLGVCGTASLALGMGFRLVRSSRRAS